MNPPPHHVRRAGGGDLRSKGVPPSSILRPTNFSVYWRKRRNASDGHWSAIKNSWRTPKVVSIAFIALLVLNSVSMFVYGVYWNEAKRVALTANSQRILKSVSTLFQCIKINIIYKLLIRSRLFQTESLDNLTSEAVLLGFGIVVVMIIFRMLMAMMVMAVLHISLQRFVDFTVLIATQIHGRLASFVWHIDRMSLSDQQHNHCK
jgi:hypothetical protein